MFGKTTSATTPSAAWSAMRRSSSQLRTPSVSCRSLNGFLYLSRQASNVVAVRGVEVLAVLLVGAAGVAVGRDDRVAVGGALRRRHENRIGFYFMTAHDGLPPEVPLPTDFGGVIDTMIGFPHEDMAAGVRLHHPPDQGQGVQGGLRVPGRVHVQGRAREGAPPTTDDPVALTARADGPVRASSRA